MWSRVAQLLSVAGSIVLCLAATATAAKPARDTMPPSVSFSAPTSGSTVRGTIAVTGTADDNTALTKVELKTDAGAFTVATGTASWSAGVVTAALAEGTHTLTVRATDRAGNLTTVQRSIVVDNVPDPAPAPTPSPSPTATPSASPDRTPPAITIGDPTGSTALTGAVDVTGSATDDIAVAGVEVAVDGAAWALAAGTTAWTWRWSTTAVADGAHTIAARATDTSGNATVTTRPVTVANVAALPAGVKEQLVTAEGVTIQIASDVSGWTAQQVYALLASNAYELGRVGPRLTVKVQTGYPSQTTTTASTANGLYTSFKATIYLRATATSTFTAVPDSVVAHEYGHAWSMHHLYLVQQGSWDGWLAARGLTGEARLESTYNWSRNEMLADDYRMLFGSAAAIAQSAHLNPDVPDPRGVAGLREYLATAW